MKRSMNRREFCNHAWLAPVIGAAGCTLIGSHRAALARPIVRTGTPKLKTSLNAYSFNHALNDQLKGRAKGVSLFDLLEFCADANIDAFDPTGYFFPGYPNVPSEKYLNDFKRRAFQLGVEISGTGVHNDFATPDRMLRAADVHHVKEWIECAARMGAPVLRVFAGTMPEGYAWEKVASWMVDELKKCVAHAAKFGVVIGIQNRGDMLKSAEDVIKIVQMVDSDWFGVVVDTGAFQTPDPYQDIARVLPYAVNWRLKEKLDGPEGSIKIDMKRLVKIIEDAGYRGYIPIETLAAKDETNYDPRSRVLGLLAALREAMNHGS